MFSLSRSLLIGLTVTSVSCGVSRQSADVSHLTDDNDIGHNFVGGFDSSFDDYIGSTMYDYRIPGVALAVIKGNQVIYSAAYGYSDYYQAKSAKLRNVFGVGSVTKGFLAATILKLADQGILDLDKPIKEYLPEIDLMDQEVEETATLKDLLLHRTGLPTHDFAFYGSEIDRDQLFERMKNLQFNAHLGEKWQYSNIMYMVAGTVVERVTGRPWYEVVQENVAGPLGMDHTSFTFSGLLNNPNKASGYFGKKNNGLPLKLDYRSFDIVGPAGGMNSTVGDLSNWVKLLLHKGELNGTQVLPEQVIADLIEPRQVMGVERLHPLFSESVYAYGWTSQEYRDRRISWHTGDVDGFKSLVGFMPDDDVGFVILTNCNSDLNLKAFGAYILDRALGFPETDWVRELTAEDSNDNNEPDSRAMPSGYSFSGVYTNPGYGKVSVGSTWGGIDVRINSFIENEAYFTGSAGGKLGFYQPNFFSAARRKISFEADNSGRAQKLFWQLEPNVEPIVFVRQ
ncbi:MAG: serine hydrolase domain-containing protein [Oligoflexales bacterium]